MPNPADIAAAPDQPVPPRDGSGAAMPAGIALGLLITRTLIRYGAHLLLTLESRAAVRSFAFIAACFGTAQLPPILARLRRGILRARALEQVLLARAARGRDLKARPRWEYFDPREPRPDASPAEAAALRTAPPAPRRRAAPEGLLDIVPLPSPEELHAQVSRRPLGSTVLAICRDLGIRPVLCSVGFWNQIDQAFHWYRGSHLALARETVRREIAYGKEVDRFPRLSMPHWTRDATERALGFFIGEQPFNPYPPVTAMLAAAATGPP